MGGIGTGGRHAVPERAGIWPVDRKAAGAGIDQHKAIAHSDCPGGERNGHHRIRQTAQAKCRFDLLSVGISDETVTRRSLKKAIHEGVNLQVAHDVPAKSRSGSLSLSGSKERDGFVQTERNLGTNCAQYEVAARELEHRRSLMAR